MALRLPAGATAPGRLHQGPYKLRGYLGGGESYVPDWLNLAAS